MSQLTTSTSRTLLIVSVVIILILSTLFVWKYVALSSVIGTFANTTQDNVSEDAPPGITDPLLLGQYYFNHDDDPAGPYDREKARKYYSMAIAENPKGNALAWYQLGRIDFIEGDFVRALYNFEKQFEYFGDSIPNIYYMIGLTYGYKARDGGSESDWRKSEEAFLKYIELDPDTWAGRVDLSWVYFAQGKYEEMVPLLESGLQLHGDEAWVLNMYGLALLNTDRKDEALVYFYEARDRAKLLSVDDWGRAYPGNDPADWPQGLKEFREAIDKNIALFEDSE